MAARHGAKFALYNHTNTGKLAAFVEYTGDNADAAFQVAIQVVAFPPTFLKKDDVPQAVIENEIKIETQRAINDGKPAEVAEKIAQGRVNKEYYQSQVLLEQPITWTRRRRSRNTRKRLESRSSRSDSSVSERAATQSKQ